MLNRGGFMKHTIVLDLGYSNLDKCNLSYKTEEFEFKTVSVYS